MAQRSIFFDEWIKSLREQYKYVIRNNDNVTLLSLTEVMHDVGFTDAELAQLRVEATMRAEDVADDFVPDLKILEQPSAGQPHPAECTCPQCVPIDESQYDADGQPLEIDPEQATHETGHMFTVAKPENDLEETVADLEETQADLTFEEETVADIKESVDDLTFVDNLEETVTDLEETQAERTFEDSLSEETELIEVDDMTEVDDEPEDDPDKPKQMSMF